MDEHADRTDQAIRSGDQDVRPAADRNGRFSISPRLSYLLIGGAALGLIVLMCLIVALVALAQNS